jgi:YfiH family protein
MIRKSTGGIEWLEFEILAQQPGLVHGVFLRHGGVSSGPYASLNAGGGSGDEVSHIEENRQRLLKVLNLKSFVSGKQVHGDEVIIVESMLQLVGDCDALMTEKIDLGLMIKHADCQAALIYDPVQRALANVHAGWRGNVKNIYSATVQKMLQIFGSRPEDLLVGVSPSLGPHSAEFKHYHTEFPEAFWRFQVRPGYFDLWALARYQLEQCGILPQHIEIAEICTYTNAQDYFSYRRDGVTGRHATVAGLC